MKIQIEGYLAVSEIDPMSRKVLGVVVELGEVVALDDEARALSRPALEMAARELLVHHIMSASCPAASTRGRGSSVRPR